MSNILLRSYSKTSLTGFRTSVMPKPDFIDKLEFIFDRNGTSVNSKYRSGYCPIAYLAKYLFGNKDTKLLLIIFFVHILSGFCLSLQRICGFPFRKKEGYSLIEDLLVCL